MEANEANDASQSRRDRSKNKNDRPRARPSIAPNAPGRERRA
jgi:hypothetical protein